MEQLKADVQRINQENVDIKRRLDKLEDADKRQEEDIRMLYAHQEGTKVYVNQILSKLDSLETKLFNMVTNITSNQATDRKEERKERTKATQTWIDFSKFIVAATIGAVILYLFQNGGK